MNEMTCSILANVTAAAPQLRMSFRFDLTDLQLFVHVVEAGTITGGAESSHLALASASARISGMEETLGAPLLERARRGVKPTPAGAVLLVHARTILLQTQRMSGELGDFARGLKGHLRVMCNTTAMHEYLPELLGTYLMAHPNVNVQVVESLGERIVQSVSEGSADVGIVVDTVQTFDLETLPFRTDRLVLVAPVGHPLVPATDGVAVSIFDAETFDVVGLIEGSALQETWDEHAARRGVRLNYRVRVRSFDAQCRLIERGVGLALMPEQAARRHSQTMALRVLSLKEPWLESRPLRLCVRSFAALSIYGQRFVEHLRARE
jgi:DNA-binding transcriptional LysR family regulator